MRTIIEKVKYHIKCILIFIIPFSIYFFLDYFLLDKIITNNEASHFFNHLKEIILAIIIIFIFLFYNNRLYHTNYKLTNFSKAVEESPLSIVICDRNGIIEYVNKYFVELTLYTKKDAVGNNPNILKSGFHDDTFYKELWETISSGQTWHGELYNKKKNDGYYENNQSIGII